MNHLIIKYRYMSMSNHVLPYTDIPRKSPTIILWEPFRLTKAIPASFKRGQRDKLSVRIPLLQLASIQESVVEILETLFSNCAWKCYEWNHRLFHKYMYKIMSHFCFGLEPIPAKSDNILLKMWRYCKLTSAKWHLCCDQESFIG